ncbi:MAG: hypothetical protein RJB34_739 [Pseudomonadota bacterium]|jgi:hypothetical protein
MQPTFITVLLAALAAIAAWQLKPEQSQSPPAPPIVSVEEMGTLTTLRVNYANVIEFNERLTQDIPWTQWELRFGGTRVLLIARGECLLGTELALAMYVEVQPAQKMATLSLPKPKVISARLNHDAKAGGSYFYTVTNNGVAALLPGTEGQTQAMNRALQKAQAELEASCSKPELIAAAKTSAEAVLQPTVSATGWKIKTVWR